MITQYPHPELCSAGTSTPIPAFRIKGEPEVYLTRAAAEWVLECRKIIAASREGR